MEDKLQNKVYQTFNREKLTPDDNAGKAVFIPVPWTGNSNSLSYLKTFNALADSPAPQAVGQVVDMDGFSRSLGWPDDAKKVEMYIKAPGTGFYIPPEYAQFEPAIQQMIDRYYSLYGEDGFCALAVHQAVIKTDDDACSRPYIAAHKDVTVARVKEEGGAPDCYVQVVSDTLQTGFSDFNLSDGDIQNLENSDDPDKTFQEIIDKSDIKFKSFDPGTIVAFSARTVHALANPQEPTWRTVVITAFSPATESVRPEAYNNPWLEEVVAGRESAMTATENAFPRGDI